VLIAVLVGLIKMRW